MKNYVLLLDPDQIDDDVYFELINRGYTTDRSLSADLPNAYNLTLKMLTPEIQTRKLAYRTYTNQKGLRVNPYDLAEKEHFGLCNQFERYRDDYKVQIQFYLNDDPNASPTDEKRPVTFIGIVLLILLPVDMYHPEIYSDKIRTTYSSAFNYAVGSEVENIPVFNTPCELIYIHVKEEYRNKGYGTKMIKKAMKKYTFVTCPTTIMIKRTLIAAGCIAYTSNIYRSN